MGNQVTKTLTEECAYQLFKNLFRFKDIDAVKEGLQRAVEARFEDAACDGEVDVSKAVSAEAKNQAQMLRQLWSLLAGH